MPKKPLITDVKGVEKIARGMGGLDLSKLHGDKDRKERERMMFDAEEKSRAHREQIEKSSRFMAEMHRDTAEREEMFRQEVVTRLDRIEAALTKLLAK